MENTDISCWAEKFSSQLYGNILPFWKEHSTDTRYGGFLHQFDRDGKLNSTDKGIWVQGRYTWLLSWLASMEKNPSSRDAYLLQAESGVRFILDHVFDPAGRCYYLVRQNGTPVRQRRYLFSEVFVALGLHTYGSVAGTPQVTARAEELVALIERYIRNPSLLPAKNIPEAGTLKSHSMTMILINLYQQMRKNTADQSARDILTEKIARQITEFFSLFFHPEEQAVVEYVADDGSIVDSPEGREINPGHTIETAWFIMEEYRYTGKKEYLEKALEIIDWAFARGWDTTYGGLLSFVDLYGHDSPHIEGTMKYWWPHTEALYATLLAYKLTGKEIYARHFSEVASYLFERFPDPEYPEWFGYLNRDGSVACAAKGNLWKGPFHIPRSLRLCLNLFESAEK